ncbi:hypothetical protein CTheo_4818 [Ceratobasidium theobromae]|uniref:Uncharacterized protein n=1 Tax=Ceratobasidium theobromae TaxID=1582974 RepID=A0A5N5QJD1_9AGAM|nr:hypothetical protein CTheo_4818 [Ceratobasidium theobromae]
MEDMSSLYMSAVLGLTCSIILPHEIKLLISRELYDSCSSPEEPGYSQDLVALSMLDKSWRTAALPYLYSQCNIGGRGNFALQNWINRISPQYGHFVKLIDLSLCWMDYDHLPEQEQEMVKAGHDAITKPWEEARDALIAQLVAGLSNLSKAIITIPHCINSPASRECTCLNYFSGTVQAFGQRRMESIRFHGTGANFCPRLARSIFMQSANSLRSVLFSDLIDGCPSPVQPFESLAQLPELGHLSFAAESFRLYDLGSLDWRCPLESIVLANEAGGRTAQKLPIEQLNNLLGKFSSSLRSLALHDILIDNPSNIQATGLLHLVHVTVQSTCDSTFRTLDLLRGHSLETLSVVVVSVVKHTPLFDALENGAFPKLQRINIRLKEGRGTPSCWDSTARAEIEEACKKRDIELIMTGDKRQKDLSAKVRVRRRTRS